MCARVAPLSAKVNEFLNEKFGDPASGAISAEPPSPSIARTGSLPVRFPRRRRSIGMRATPSGFE
jgi:hypothetical protein